MRFSPTIVKASDKFLIFNIQDLVHLFMFTLFDFIIVFPFAGRRLLSKYAILFGEVLNVCQLLQ